MDPKDKKVLITGGSSGIGLEAAVQLAKKGAEIVLAARDKGKLDAAVSDVKTRAESSRVSSMLCDFGSQAAIRALAAEYAKKHARLDILINNVGSVSPTRNVTVDGLEQTFAVNHIGYFLLTNLLLDALEGSAPSRVVNVASDVHKRGDLDFDDLQMEKSYGTVRAYGRSKLANVLFTRELARRVSAKKITVNCLHPGAVATNIWSRAPAWAAPIVSVARLFMLSPAQGGERIVYLATSDELEGRTGGYYEKNALVEPSALARDDGVAKKLWETSAKLTGLSLN